MSSANLSIYCVDAGSLVKTRRKFAWARVPEPEDCDGNDIDDLVQLATDDLLAGRGVALGFESPLAFELRDDPMLLTTKRWCDPKARAWSAGAGATVFPTAIAQLTWVLRKLRVACPLATAHPTLPAFKAASSGLFVWEAMVTGKSAEGLDDRAVARNAAQAFRRALETSSSPTQPQAEVFSFIGAALVRTNWADAASWLGIVPLVVEA